MGLLPQYEQKERLKAAFRAAFPCTIPIFMGFWFLELAYDVYMHVSGYIFLRSASHRSPHIRDNAVCAEAVAAFFYLDIRTCPL